ncbi:MAG: hypothetical protein L3J32_05400 [Rhizobiaceae bacterium]|nr:hypothetical protein [Rhizobiaceae bacterium]
MRYFKPSTKIIATSALTLMLTGAALQLAMTGASLAQMKNSITLGMAL